MILTALEDQSEALIPGLSAQFEPPERLPLSSWAEKNINLSSEYSAKTGELELYSWQREIFDAFTDPKVSEITLMCGTQLTKTLLLQCALAYIIKEAPGPILMVYPKADDAKAFSKERLGPMLRDISCLRGLVSESSHDGNTILMKEFPGGSLSLVGAGAPGNLARRSIRYLFADEIDKNPLSSGKEGDPIKLGAERLVTFRSRAKLIRVCSPTLFVSSRINAAYQLSDRRKPYVPCHICGFKQVLRFRPNVRFDTSLSLDLQPDSAYYECANPDCVAPWDDNQRWWACDRVEWRADKPFTGHAGFWISHLYSPYKRLKQITKQFIEARNDRNALQVFINTTLAEVWVEEGQTPDGEVLFARREHYDCGDDVVVPKRALFLTASVDVQDSPPRLEVELIGWGRGRENWSLGYWVIQAYVEGSTDPLPVGDRRLWDQLDQLLMREWPHEGGQTMPIRVMTIDTGKKPKPVYEFALRHARILYGPEGMKLHAVRTVVPIKGDDDPLKIISKVSKEDASRKRQGVRIVSIGTHCVKQELFDALQAIKPNSDPDIPVPGCYHHPDYNLQYFEGLAGEVKVVLENGKVEYQKKNGVRNEPLDLKVYNRAAASIVGIDRATEKFWLLLEKQLGLDKPAVVVSAPSPPPLALIPPALVGPTDVAAVLPPPTPSPVLSSPPRAGLRQIGSFL